MNICLTFWILSLPIAFYYGFKYQMKNNKLYLLGVEHGKNQEKALQAFKNYKRKD